MARDVKYTNQLVGDFYLWEVRASDRPESAAGNWSNLCVFVVAETMERAIALFRLDNPDAKLHQVQRRNTLGRDLIVDPGAAG